jgi:hypothetical protein
MDNPLKNSGAKYIETFDVGERFGMDVMGQVESKYIVTDIDYFSRKGFRKVINNRF